MKALSSLLSCLALAAAACSHDVTEARPAVEIADDNDEGAITFVAPSEVDTQRVYLGDLNFVNVSDELPWHYGLFDLNPGARIRIDLFQADGSDTGVGFKVYRVRNNGSLKYLGVVDGVTGWAAATLRSPTGGSYVVESVSEVVPASLALSLECRSRDGRCAPKAQPTQLCGTRGALQCDDGLFCLIDEGCGADDRGGQCQRPVEVCAAVAGPVVCGCDGKEYGTACEANAAGVNVGFVGGCPCDPLQFTKNVNEAVDVVGSWTGKSENDSDDVSSRLTLNADGTFVYEQVWDPKCLHVAPFCRRASRVFVMEGTWENQVFAVQLTPSQPAPDELAQSFGVEISCDGTVRLTTTEMNIDRVLEIDPCSRTTCAAGERCEVVQIVCVRAPCYPIAQCVAE